MKTKYLRRNLRESLEAFAKRHALPIVVARPFWRREGMRLLGLANGLEMGYLNITPGANITWPEQWKAVECDDEA